MVLPERSWLIHVRSSLSRMSSFEAAVLPLGLGVR